MAVHRARVASWCGRAVALAVLAVSLTCGGDAGGGGTDAAVLSGTAYWSGPIRGATVVVHQLVDGQRTLELARTTTGDDGTWSVNHDGYEHIEIDVIGGSYTEASGGDVTLDANTTLRGVALDLTINEQRAGVTISPWTHLAVALGRARWVSGAKEPTYGAAVTKAIERFTNHLGFDPTKTAVAPVSASASSPTEQVKYGLSLAGLSELASLIATDQSATVQSVNSVELTKVLARDGGSAEALLDGNGSELLLVGASCPPPTGCTMEGPGCYASCAVHTNTLRSRLGSAVLAFLLTPENRTMLTRDDVAPWLEAVRTNVDAELFGTETTEPFDSIGPTITWQAPAESATVAGLIAVEVTAADPVGVMSLTVTAETPTPMNLVDTDPAPERFAATFSTVGLAEGALTLTATATDTEENTTNSPRMINLNNVSGGTVSGIVYKGRVGAATVRIYEFQNGVRGAMRGQGTSQTDGSFTNVMISDGYTGPLLVEAGFGGTYPEEAASATVTLDVNDRLRTVIPSYADGGAIANVMVTPLTSFATTYFEYLQTSSQGGTTVPMRWTTARTAMETHFGVANIYDLTPLSPGEMTTFNAQARYGMLLVGLSETARTASTLGGGDGGTFGSAMNAMRVFRVLDTDLADGCWDGRQSATQLYFGGTRALTVRSTRRDLANQIVSYLNDGARNQTPYAGAADVLSQLDTLSDGGGNIAVGSCSATGRLNPDAGTPFDQTRPVVSFNGSTPPAGFVRGTITVDAVATDDLDTRPTLQFMSPPMTADADGDISDSDSHHTWDTTTLPDGPLVVTLQAVDDAGNVSDPALSTRTFTVDNRDPTVGFNIMPNSWHPTPGPIVTYTVTEMNVASVTALLDGIPFNNNSRVSSEGRHDLVVTVQDQAGAMVTGSLTFYVDLSVPTFAFGPITPSGSVVKDTLSITVDATDNMMGVGSGSLGANISVTATDRNGAAVMPSLSYPMQGGGARQVVATFDTNNILDGQLTVRFNISDRAGNPATELSRSWIVDNIDPQVVISGISMNQNTWYPAAPTITFTQTDANPGTTTATLDMAMVSSPTTVNSEGRHTLVVTATDQAGNMTTSATLVFYVDLMNPMLAIVPPNPNGMWIRGMYDVTVEATDTLQAIGSLSNNLTATITSSPGTAPPGTSYPAASGGARRIRNQIDTTMIAGAAVASGSLSVQYTVSDASGRAASPSVAVAVMVDNNPPDVTINPVGVNPIPNYTRNTTPTITGTVETGGAPVSINVSIAGQSASVTPSGGSWSWQVPIALAEGQHTVNATATDQAGNVAPATSVTVNVDLTGPTVSFRQSDVRDETACDVNVNVSPVNGTIMGPVNYASCATATLRDFSMDFQVVGKFISRITSNTADNPLRWKLSASDAGSGLANAGSTIQFQIYRLGQAPGAVWVDSANLSQTVATALDADAFATSADWPQLLTHTDSFVMAVRAVDRLGNPSASQTRIWSHKPIALPVHVGYQGLPPAAPEAGTYDSNDPEEVFNGSLLRHSLTPQGNQIGLAGAMSGGGIGVSAPRALYEFEVYNPHPVAVNVGFFVPNFGGATWSRKIWEVNPWLNASFGVINTPTGFCSWPSNAISMRVSGSASPATCGSNATCTCNGAGGWFQPTESIPSTASWGSLTSANLTVEARVLSTDANGGWAVVAPLSIQPTIVDQGTTYTFYEFSVPPRSSATTASRMRVFVSLPNLDLYSPAADAFETVIEDNGPGAEIVKHSVTNNVPTMTRVSYERWADCYTEGVNCQAIRLKRRFRATVEARINVAATSLYVYARQRATNAPSSSVEKIPDSDAVDNFLRGNDALNWDNCEKQSPFAGGVCDPDVPTSTTSSIN